MSLTMAMVRGNDKEHYGVRLATIAKTILQLQ